VELVQQRKKKKKGRLKGQMVSMRKEESIRYEVWRNDILYNPSHCCFVTSPMLLPIV
jgi:hypothetical protein